MPLPPPSPREELHQRRIDLRGYRRDDGLFDIEARLVDTKSHAMTLADGRPLDAGEAIHDMSIRLVVDVDLQVHEVQACIDASPYRICPEVAATLQRVVGLRIGPGWSRAVRERFAGPLGCTHLTELLQPLATVAYQTTWPSRRHRPDPVDAHGRPRKIDSCHAYASSRELVRQRWPDHYTGPGD